MKTKLNKFPDELQYQIVQEYLTTEITYDELKKKYNFGGNDNIRLWMIKFGISKQEVEQIKQDRVMTSESSKSPKELELEHKIRLLEDELNKEKLKTAALTTLIDIAERDLKIDIKKKAWCQAINSLRANYPRFSLGDICELFGKSRQAYYQREKYNYKEQLKDEILLQMVMKERKLMPKIGARKLLVRLEPRIPEDLLPGRDKFFDFLRDHRLLVGKKRRRVRTTYSNHWMHKYPNLINDFTATHINQLWVSDITYIVTAQGFLYLNLISDAYSREIIGWSVGETLEAIYTVSALEMALRRLPRHGGELIHHSDRGVQYCCSDYVKKLSKHNVSISMTENGDPRENAIAERINGILKDEWLNMMLLMSLEDAKKQLKRIIMIYNCHRPHSSLGMKTPREAACLILK